MSPFDWLALLVAADLQVCGLYSFITDVSMKRFFTHLLSESIAAARKSLSYVINKALASVRFKYYFEQSRTLNVLL